MIVKLVNRNDLQTPNLCNSINEIGKTSVLRTLTQLVIIFIQIWKIHFNPMPSDLSLFLFFLFIFHFFAVFFIQFKCSVLRAIVWISIKDSNCTHIHSKKWKSKSKSDSQLVQGNFSTYNCIDLILLILFRIFNSLLIVVAFSWSFSRSAD